SATTLLSFASQPTPPPTAGVNPEPPGFGVAAASFITAQQGWALGSTGCAGCAGITATSDGGSTWASLPAPPTTLGWYSSSPSAVTDILFTDASHGYLFGPGLFSTANGGRSWTDERLRGVKSLTIAGSYVYALTGYNNTGTELLYRSRVGGSQGWQLVQVPAETGQGQAFQIYTAGTDLVLLETGLASVRISPSQLGRIWVSTDQGVYWQPRTVPCTVTDGGAAVLSIASGHPQAWMIDCYSNQQSSQEQNTRQHIYGTSDGGRTWVRLGDPPQHNGPDLLADNGAGHAFLATEGVADTLNSTLDGGQNWTVTIRDGGSFYGWADLRFIDANTGYVVGPTHYATEHLYRTTDGGQTWNALHVSP
ncbi:MAG: WD40/YVTN/BNR-like repeat-containing protein, partial [Acidimicrobiales bacterium]